MAVYGVTLDIAEIAIAIGIGVSMIFYERLNLVPGGVIVPGYVALTLDRPYMLLSTFAVAIVTLFLINKVSNHLVLFGRRKFSFMMLMSFLVAWTIQSVVAVGFPIGQVSSIGPTGVFQVIGFFIPGLVANSMEREGGIKTIFCPIIVSVFTYVFLYLFTRQ